MKADTNATEAARRPLDASSPARTRRPRLLAGSATIAALLLVLMALVGASTALASPPTVTTEAATNVAEQKATLNGTVNPNGKSTYYRFEWGTTTTYGNTIPKPEANIGSGTSPIKVSQTISGLEEGKTYHVRVMAYNTNLEVTYGHDVEFTEPVTHEWMQGGKGLIQAVEFAAKTENAIFATRRAGLSTLQCSFKTTGTVGPIAKREITGITELSGSGKAVPCAIVNGSCERKASIEALNLPWKTELVDTNNELRDKITGGTGGSSAWKITCWHGSNPEVELEETCPAQAEPLVRNYSEGVEALYSTPEVECTNNYLERSLLHTEYTEKIPGFAVK